MEEFYFDSKLNLFDDIFDGPPVQKVERMEKVDKVDKVEKGDRGDKGDKGEKVDKVEKVEKVLSQDEGLKGKQGDGKRLAETSSNGKAVDHQEEEGDDWLFQKKEVGTTSSSPLPSEEPPSEGVYKLLAKGFFDYLGWDWDDNVIKEDSPDGFFQMLEDVIKQNSVPQYSSPFVEELDKFVAQGGDPVAFIELQRKYDLPDINLEDVQDQAYAVYYHLKMTTPLSDEKIKRYIEKLHEDGALRKEAEESLNLLRQHKEQERQRMERELQEKRKREQEERQRYVQQLQDFVMRSDAQSLGVEMTKGEREKFFRFITEVDPKTGMTPYQTKVQQDPYHAVRLAALVYKGALDGKLEMIAKRKVVDELEEKLKKGASQLFSKSPSKGAVTRDDDFSLF